MEEEKCMICEEKKHERMIWDYMGKSVNLCIGHCREFINFCNAEYPDHVRMEIPLSQEQFSDVIRELSYTHTLRQMHAMKQNAEYMSHIMDSWQDGCLSNLEAVNKMAILADETRTIALNLKGGE